MTLRFEDLILDPVCRLMKVCEFCGTSYDSTMLDYPKYTTYGPPDPKSVMSWKRYLSAEDLQLVEARIGPMLAERGYELSNLPPLAVTPKMERRLRRQDYWARLRFRLRRYGLALVLQETLTRRLGLWRWHKTVQRQIHAIVIANLK